VKTACSYVQLSQPWQHKASKIVDVKHLMPQDRVILRIYTQLYIYKTKYSLFVAKTMGLSSFSYTYQAPDIAILGNMASK